MSPVVALLERAPIRPVGQVSEAVRTRMLPTSFSARDPGRALFHVLNNSGIRLVKLFLHIAADEQVRRFRGGLIDPLKLWKLSYEDFYRGV